MARVKLLIANFALALLAISSWAEVGIRGDWLYIDGEKYLVRGIGYSPFRKARDYESISNELVREDFRRIVAAGFNTILTWDVIPDRVIELAESYGLNIIMGIWIGPRPGYTDSIALQRVLDRATRIVTNTRNYDNVIMYVFSGEPDPKSILEVSIEGVTLFYQELVDIVHALTPGRPVGMSNWVKSCWLDMSSFDVACYNLYGHDFDDTRADIGMESFISWLRTMPGNQNKPFLVTEFGYSVSPRGEGNYGYGGNTLEEQAIGDVRLYRQIVQSGAIGACVFEWNDEWWKAGKPFEHSPTAEEWFGIIGIEDENDEIGKPRPVYYALQEAFKVVVIKPKGMSKISGKLNFEINSLPSISCVEYQVDNSSWNQLNKHGNWWRGEWDSTNSPDGEKIIKIRGIQSGKVTETQEFHIWSYNQEPIVPRLVNIDMKTDKHEYHLMDKMKIEVTLTDENHGPIPDYPVKIAFEKPDKWNVARWDEYTDQNGCLVKDIRLAYRQHGYYLIYITVEYHEGNNSKRYSKILQFWLE